MTIDGLNWILSMANPHPRSPAVVSLSTYRTIVDTNLTAFEQAIASLISNGITVVASANNQDANACDTSPARMSRNSLTPNKVITVGGAMLRNNPDPNPADGGPSVQLPEPAYDPLLPTRYARWRCHAGDSDTCSGNLYANPPASAPVLTPQTQNQYTGTTLGSNGGRCVTLFAPAKNIPGASLDGFDTCRNPRVSGGFASGTSWSAPIVAGMAARIRQTSPGLTVDGLFNALMARTGRTF